jgi:hypothetical protein
MTDLGSGTEMVKLYIHYCEKLIISRLCDPEPGM